MLLYTIKSWEEIFDDGWYGPEDAGEYGTGDTWEYGASDAGNYGTGGGGKNGNGKAGKYWTGDIGEYQNNSITGEIEIKQQGRSFLVQPLPGGQMKINRIISTDPMDYLNPDWQPGSIFSIRR